MSMRVYSAHTIYTTVDAKSTVDANKNATIFAHLSQPQHASGEAELAAMPTPDKSPLHGKGFFHPSIWQQKHT